VLDYENWLISSYTSAFGYLIIALGFITLAQQLEDIINQQLSTKVCEKYRLGFQERYGAEKKWSILHQRLGFLIGNHDMGLRSGFPYRAGSVL